MIIYALKDFECTEGAFKEGDEIHVSSNDRAESLVSTGHAEYERKMLEPELENKAMPKKRGRKKKVNG